MCEGNVLLSVILDLLATLHPGHCSVLCIAKDLIL